MHGGYGQWSYEIGNLKFTQKSFFSKSAKFDSLEKMDLYAGNATNTSVPVILAVVSRDNNYTSNVLYV